MENKFLRGTFFLTAATLISKVLGFLYIIPFTALVGIHGYALYQYAYKPYTIFLSISTIGLPLAVSKFVSKYNEQGNYKAGLTLLRYGMLLMMVSGIVSFTILYSLAPSLARVLSDPDSLTGNTVEDVEYVIRLVSFALLIIPPMSILRGYFQGSQPMGPSAISTVLEQVVRIVFILAGAYTAIHILNQSIRNAVGLATFAAFIGGVAGFAVLIVIILSRKKLIKKQMEESSMNENVAVIPMFKELIGYAIPFVVTGLTIPIFQNIDTFTINKLFRLIDYTLLEAEKINSVIGLTQILIMVPVSLATAFGMSLIPGITSSFTNGKIGEVQHKITRTLQTLMFFILPAAIGLTILSKPIFLMIFGNRNSPDLGGEIMQSYSMASVIFALFTVTTAIMQGVNKQKKVMIGIMIGVIIKIVLNIIFIPTFKEVGPVIATYCGLTVSVMYNAYFIQKTIGFDYMTLFKTLKPIIFLSAIMSVAVISVKLLTEIWLLDSHDTYFNACIVSIVSIMTGALVYLGMGAKSNLLNDLGIAKYGKYKKE